MEVAKLPNVKMFKEEKTENWIWKKNTTKRKVEFQKKCKLAILQGEKPMFQLT